MSDDDLKDVRACARALDNVLLLAAMPKKTEAALRQISVRLNRVALPAPQAEQVTG